jgi:hypothetical protein
MLLFLEKGPSWHSGSMKLCSLETISPLTVVEIKLNLVTEAGCSPKPDSICIINVAIPDVPVLTGGPALVRPDHAGQVFLHIANAHQIHLLYKEVNLSVSFK